MLYNLAIETQSTGIKFIQAINDFDLEQFVSAYKEGRHSVTINGLKLNISYPELIKIFDVSKKITPTSRSLVVNEMQKWVNIMNNGNLSLEALREFGEDVTSDFIKGGWGEIIDESSSGDYSQGDFSRYTSIKAEEFLEGKRRYWAGGFGKFGGANERLEDFKVNNYWQALDYDEDSNQNIAEAAWNLFKEIKIGDWFLIKGYGGGQNMNIHYLGEVIGKNNESGKLDFKNLNIIPYSTTPPKGEGAGNWFLTLLEVYRQQDIQKLFYYYLP